MKALHWAAALGAVALVGSLCPAARADDPTPKFEFHQQEPTKPKEPATVWNANVQFGLTWIHGNAQSIGFSGGGVAGFKHFNNQLQLTLAGAYARTGTSDYDGGPITSTKTAAANWLAMLRYDRFLTQNNSAYVSFEGAADYLAGYDYLLEPQVGYQRIFFHSDHQDFRGDIGYDYSHFQYVAGAMPHTQDYHSARFFLGYANKFTPYASFSEGAEVLWALNDIGTVRVNSITSLSSTVSKRVSLKLNFTVKANTNPPNRPLDPTTMMSEGPFQKVDELLEAVLAVTLL